MSVFDKYTLSEHVEAVREFLGIPRKGFLERYGLVEPTPGRVGRAPRYADDAVRALQQQANQKAARADLPDGTDPASSTTRGERIRLARDYAFKSDSDVAREMGCSREMVRRWGENLNKPTDLVKLGEVLKVPAAWLEHGGAENLPADCRVGVRVGEEALQLREQMYALTTQLMSEAEYPLGEPADFAQAYLEWAVYAKPALAQAARKAGGRWQLVGDTLLFAPWEPIPEHGLARRLWTDEVEAIIQEELNRPGVSTYGAWDAMKARCEAKGLAYPARISLFKRVENERKRAQQFGVNLNAMVQASVQKYATC